MHHWDERNGRRFLLFTSSLFFLFLFCFSWFLMFTSLVSCVVQGPQSCFFPSMGRLIWGLAMQDLLTHHQQWCMLDRSFCYLRWYSTDLSKIDTAPLALRPLEIYIPVLVSNQHTRVISSFGVCGSHDCITVWYCLLLLCYQHQL